MRFLVNRINVLLNEIRGPMSRDNFRASFSVDRYGMVEADRDTLERLVEEEIVELRAIGPEDSEYFLTGEWHAYLAPQIHSLTPDWFKVTPDPYRREP